MISEDKILRIEMKQFGKTLSIRSESKDVFLKIKKSFQLNSYDMIIVDFKGVDIVTSGFAFDLFNYFKFELRETFLQKIRVSFEPVPSETLIRSVVKGAFNATLAKTNA